MTEATDWTEGRYVRVFASLQADYPEVWASDGLLAWYVRLLSIADATWPSPAPWPRGLPEEVEGSLVEAGAIDRRGPGYLVSGMARLRDQDLRLRQARIQGGRNRAAQAVRDAQGRMVPGQVSPGDLDQDSPGDLDQDPPRTPGPSRTPPGHLGGPGGLNGADPDPAPGGVLVTPPGTRSSSYQTRRDQTSMEASGLSIEVGDPEEVARPGVRANGAPIDCDDYRAHQSQHVQVAGVGWKCLACEAARAAAAAAAGEPTFRDRVAQRGGWTPDRRPSDDRPF